MLLEGFHLNGHTVGFLTQSQTLEGNKMSSGVKIYKEVK